MAKTKVRQGLCPNEDGCTKASNYEIQNVSEGEPFKCEECGHELEPIDNKKGSGLDPKIIIIIGAVVVVGIIAALIFAIGGTKEEVVEPVVIEEPTDTIAESPAVMSNRNDTLVIKVENIEQSIDTIAVENLVEEKIPEERTTPKQGAPTHSASSSSSSSLSKNLGYATWTGGWKNGKPHGAGTMTYSTSRTIDSRDPKGRVAQPGEYIVGEWDNGNLVQGRWFKKDGSKEAIIIGKAG